MLRQPAPLAVEVRLEGWKSYCLVPLAQSVLGLRGTDLPSLLWVHDEAWARLCPAAGLLSYAQRPAA